MKKDNVYFLTYYLTFFPFNTIVSSTSQPLLTSGKLHNQYYIRPPLSEQVTITDYLDSATTKIDKKVELIKQKIALLKEYKQSLIYEAVTGKLDVTAQA